MSHECFDNTLVDDAATYLISWLYPIIYRFVLSFGAWEALGLLWATLPGSIDICVKTDTEACQVQPGIINLCSNVAHAMPDGGELSGQVSRVSLNAASARQYSGIQPGKFFTLTGCDAGVGMPPETLEKILPHILPPGR